MRDEAYKVCPSCEGRANEEHQFCPSCGADVASIPIQSGDLWLGTTIEGRYRLDEVIGSGAMGRVYRATQTSLNKSFAVKVLHTHLTNDAASRDRFANEAHNAASLNHPNVVSVVDYGTTPDEMTYLAMEFVEGKSLEAVITEEYPLARSRIVDLCLQILAALTEAHGLGILHRDLKPENILVQTVKTHGELVKVLDFGIAKLMDDWEQQRPGLTGHGQVCGTPEYMSPEQARGHRLDARSDLYAVGIILYQMLAGRVPFDSQSAVEILQRHINEAPVPPSKLTDTNIGALEGVCLKAISKDPDDRFENATKFRERLVSALRDSPELVIECSLCGATLNAAARFCASCGAVAPPRSGAPTRTRSITQVSDMSLPATSGDSDSPEGRVSGFPLKLQRRSEHLNWMHEFLASPPPTIHFSVFRGPTGAGKSRLLAEFSRLATQAQWRVYITGAEPRTAAPSLWPIKSVVRDSLNIDPAQEISAQILGRSANISGLSFEALPGLAELFDLDGPARSAELSVRRRECFSAALEAMTLSGAETPTLILFDDIDRFDSASRAVLRRLRHLVTRRPVLIVCTTCEEDLAWLDIEPVELAPLEAADLLPLEKSFGLESGALQENAPMLPLAVNLHLRLARKERPVAPSERADLEALAIAYLEDNSPLERALLEAAAVYGESIAEDVFDELLSQFFGQQDRRDLDEALANLHVNRVFSLDRHGNRGFEHRVLREAIYKSIPRKRRRQLHRIYAEHANVAPCLITTAMHRLKSQPLEAVTALEAAADRASLSFDDKKSASLLRAAIRTLRRASESDRISPDGVASLRLSIARLECKLAETLRLLGLLDESIEVVSVHDRHEHPAISASSLLTLARCLTLKGELDEAVSAFNRSFAPLLAEGDLSTILHTYSELARVHLMRNEPEQGLEEVMEGLDLCTHGEGPRATVDLPLWRYLLSISELHRNAKRLDEAVVWANHALFQAERLQDELAQLRTHAQIAFLLRLAERPTSAEQHLARAIERARHFGDRLTTAELLLERARLRALRGELEEARRCCQEAFRLSIELEWAEGVQHAQDALMRLGEVVNEQDGQADLM